MWRRPRRTAVAALGATLVIGLAACGAAPDPGATLQGTRAPGAEAPVTPTATTVASAGTGPAGEAPTTTAARRRGITTTTAGDTSDVTLGGANQVTAPTGAGRTTVPVTTVPVVAPALPGFVRAADPAGTVSVAVPDEWTVVPLDDRTLEDLASQGGDAFPPETRQQLQAAVAQAGQYMKVLAVGPPAADGSAATLSAIVTPGGLPLSTMRAVYPQQVEALGAELVEMVDAVVDGRPALRMRLVVRLVGGDVESTQVLVPADGSTVIVSIAGVTGPLLDRMVGAIVVPRR